jgi:hypothetical protein
VRRVLVILLVVIVVAAAGLAVRVGEFFQRSSRARAAWERERSEQVVRGLTADEVVRRFGTPDAVERDAKTGKITSVMYSGPYWNYCGIEFVDGVAVRVTFWSK